MELPEFEESEKTPKVTRLLALLEHSMLINQKLIERVEILEEEIRRLKGLKGKPNIKPSKMDKETESKSEKSASRSSSNHQTRKEITIHKVVDLKVDGLPSNAIFKGYKHYDVQEIILQCENIRYRLEKWKLPDGSYVTSQLPDHVKGCHYGATLRSFIDYQYHHQGVTQPLLLEQLHAIGIKISSGELNHLLTENKKDFHAEKDAILPIGIKASRYIHVDDTGARHDGENGYCTHIGNELFTWFKSTESKSRINFLKLLRCEQEDYVINKDALSYMKKASLRQDLLSLLEKNQKVIKDAVEWESFINELHIVDEHSIKIITEGGLVGSMLAHGFPTDIKIMSDDAGQFNINFFSHALCWIHAERKIKTLIPLNEDHAKDIEVILSWFWKIYKLLKKYKLKPSKYWYTRIRNDFIKMCKTKTSYMMLNNILERLYRNRAELLLVLEHPELPLHNNLSERDIREYVKKRKISGSTRSDDGRRCRDTFASLKKTSKKLGVNFWEYLLDRHNKTDRIPQLSLLIQQAAFA